MLSSILSHKFNLFTYFIHTAIQFYAPKSNESHKIQGKTKEKLILDRCSTIMLIP